MKERPREGGQREWQTLDFPRQEIFGEGGSIAAFSVVVGISLVRFRSRGSRQEP
jgi:hypothetical protein